MINNVAETPEHQKAVEVRNKLMAENTAEQEAVEAKKEQVMNELATIKKATLAEASEETNAIFDQFTQDRDDELGGGSLPVLRIHTSQSSENKLIDGSEPNPGQFFHTGSKTASNELFVHILSIKQAELPKYGTEDDPEYQKNYLVAGVIVDSNEPFVFYAKGVGYNKIWDLQTQLKPFVHNKIRPIPKFALFVRMYAELEQPMDKKYKPQYAAKYEVMMADPTHAIVEVRPSVVAMLGEMKTKAEMILMDIIDQKGKVKTVPVNSVAQERFNAIAQSPRELSIDSEPADQENDGSDIITENSDDDKMPF